MCYNAKFGRSAVKGVGINIGEPLQLGSAETRLSWDGRRGWAGPQIHAALHVFTA